MPENYLIMRGLSWADYVKPMPIKDGLGRVDGT